MIANQIPSKTSFWIIGTHESKKNTNNTKKNSTTSYIVDNEGNPKGLPFFCVLDYKTPKTPITPKFFFLNFAAEIRNKSGQRLKN